MDFPPDFSQFVALLQLPFMQRALMVGLLMGTAGGLMGSFVIVRRLSFFSDSLGHSALLGISLGLVFDLSQTWVLPLFSVIFALGVTYLIEKTQLWTDALLNAVYSTSLASALILLSVSNQYTGDLEGLLFGDILGVKPLEVYLIAILLTVCLIFLGLTLKTQILLTISEPLAKAKGIRVYVHRMTFLILLALVVAVSIQAVGVLLVSAFLVIPACTARLLSRTFMQHVTLSTILGGIGGVTGIVLSALFDLPSGPSVIAFQVSLLFVAIALPRLKLA